MNTFGEAFYQLYYKQEYEPNVYRENMESVFLDDLS